MRHHIIGTLNMKLNIATALYAFPLFQPHPLLLYLILCANRGRKKCCLNRLLKYGKLHSSFGQFHLHRRPPKPNQNRIESTYIYQHSQWKDIWINFLILNVPNSEIKYPAPSSQSSNHVKRQWIVQTPNSIHIHIVHISAVVELHVNKMLMSLKLTLEHSHSITHSFQLWLALNTSIANTYSMWIEHKCLKIIHDFNRFFSPFITSLTMDVAFVLLPLTGSACLLVSVGW